MLHLLIIILPKKRRKYPTFYVQSFIISTPPFLLNRIPYHPDSVRRRCLILSREQLRQSECSNFFNIFIAALGHEFFYYFSAYEKEGKGRYRSRIVWYLIISARIILYRYLHFLNIDRQKAVVSRKQIEKICKKELKENNRHQRRGAANALCSSIFCGPNYLIPVTWHRWAQTRIRAELPSGDDLSRR